MRILASIHLYPPVHNCGSEWMLHNIFKFLISKGHECRVVLHMSHKHNIQVPYIYEGVEVFGATGDVDAYRWADVIITHLDYTQYSIIMAISAKKPIVHFVHNDIPYSSIQSSVARTFIAYNSKWIADKLAYNKPFVVLPPPCDVAYYDTGEQERDCITLISLNKNKGAEMFYSIAASLPDKKFIGVVGSYDDQIILNMPNVEIVRNSPDILATYKRTRILLMPSAYESWGRTATEAMCSGIPVICTPTPGLKENCGEAGIFVGKELENYNPGEPQVDRGSVDDWIKAINKLDDPETYKKYSLLCKARATALDPLADLENFEKFLYSTQ
jgi:glycosyltransferase involved in cell wall biosynthesis